MDYKRARQSGTILGREGSTTGRCSTVMWLRSKAGHASAASHVHKWDNAGTFQNGTSLILSRLEIRHDARFFPIAVTNGIGARLPANFRGRALTGSQRGEAPAHFCLGKRALGFGRQHAFRRGRSARGFGCGWLDFGFRHQHRSSMSKVLRILNRVWRTVQPFLQAAARSGTSAAPRSLDEMFHWHVRHYIPAADPSRSASRSE